MNIIVLCHEYPPVGGGGGVGAKQYAEAWAQKGHGVTVLTSWFRGLQPREQLNGVDVIRVFTFGTKNRATVSFISMLCYCIFGFFYVLRRISKFRKQDIINSHFSVPTGVLGLLLAKVLGLPHILTIIGGDVYDPTKKSSPHRSFFMRTVNNLVMNSADQIVSISGDTKRRAGQYYKVRGNIKIINYGFVPAELNGNQSKLSLRDGKYHLIAVGRLVKRKGFEYLIRSLRLLPEDVQLTIVGDGPMELELRGLVTENDLADRVVFAGYKSRQEIYEYLQKADCFVLASLHEGLGIVVQEAMYAGLPIVSTDNGGQTDLICESRNGFLVTPKSPEMLADAILRFYTNRALADEIGRNNAKDIERYYMVNNAEEYVGLINQLVAPRMQETVAKLGTRTSTEGL